MGTHPKDGVSDPWEEKRPERSEPETIEAGTHRTQSLPCTHRLAREIRPLQAVGCHSSSLTAAHMVGHSPSGTVGR